MRILRKSRTFNAAYDMDLLNEENIYDYPPMVTVFNAFNGTYNETEKESCGYLEYMAEEQRGYGRLQRLKGKKSCHYGRRAGAWKSIGAADV